MSSSGGGEPRTVDVPLTAPAPSVSYTLPPGVTFDVEAVYVEITTAGAAGAVTAELTISEQSGVVIAKKTQGATIPAGGSGTATWALRLTDETAGGGGTDPLAVHYDTYGESGTYLDVNTTATGMRFTDSGGIQGGIYINSNGGVGGFGGFIELGTAGGEVFVGSEVVVFRFPDVDALFQIQSHIGLTWHQFDGFGGVQFRLGDAAGQSFFILDHLGHTLLQVTDAGDFLMKLPTANPGGTNRLWNNGGVVNIT